VINVLPNENMNVCACIWEADFIETLDSYLRNKAGTASHDTYYRINEATAMGLRLDFLK
jgi:hypothetical protein